MKIVIAGGDSKAEFIISMFKDRKNRLIVINPSAEVSARLVHKCKVKVYTGDPWRRIALEEADAFDADIFLALCESDTDTFACCLLAKKVFNAKKTICVVENPKNVEIFKKLGLESVISSTYLLAQSISSESSMESLTKTLSLDNDKIHVVETVVLSKYAICYKAIKDIRFPKYASIAAIYRNYQIIIPSGSVVLKPKDVLLMVTAPGNAKNLLKYVQNERQETLAKTKKLVAKFARAEEEEIPSEEESEAPARKK